MANKFGMCPICGYIGKLTVHHTCFPKNGVNPKIRERHTLLICRECHDVVHKHIYPMFDESRYYRLREELGFDDLT